MTMSALDRKIALLRCGVTMTSIAERLGLSATQVSQVVAGQRRSRRVEEAVAAAIGKPAPEVFPPRHPSHAGAA